MLLASLPLIASTLLASDVAVLTNGDRLTGTIQKLEKGKVFFLSKYSETPLQIDWAQIASLTADGPQAIEPAEDTPGWFRRAWDNSSLSADFGQSYSGLVRYNQLSSNSEVDYTGDRWDGSLVTHLDYYGATGSDGSTYQAYGRFLAQRYIRGDRFFLFPYAFLGRQTASDGGKGQIRQFGGGVGWTFRRQHSGQVSLYSGLVKSIGNGTGGHVDDTLFIAATTWDRTLKGKIATSVRLYYYKPIGQAGHNALATDASAKIPLFGPAYVSIRAYDTPELRQKQLLSVKNLQISSGIGVEF